MTVSKQHFRFLHQMALKLTETLPKKLEKEIINDGWNNWNNDMYLRETISSSKRYCDRFGVYDYIFNDITLNEIIAYKPTTI